MIHIDFHLKLPPSLTHSLSPSLSHYEFELKLTDKTAFKLYNRKVRVTIVETIPLL